MRSLDFGQLLRGLRSSRGIPLPVHTDPALSAPWRHVSGNLSSTILTPGSFSVKSVPFEVEHGSRLGKCSELCSAICRYSKSLVRTFSSSLYGRAFCATCAAPNLSPRIRPPVYPLLLAVSNSGWLKTCSMHTWLLLYAVNCCISHILFY